MNDSANQNQDANGEWIVPEISYIEPLRNACSFCGRPIARQYWQSQEFGPDLKFCNPAHAYLYATYWLEVHGAGSTS